MPIGSYNPQKVTLYDRRNLLAASKALSGVELGVQDFRKTLKETQKGDFVYVDPPYFPVSATANFTAYTKDSFGKNAQEELASFFGAAATRGVNLLLSNSDTPFIRALYKDFKIQTVTARRAVNCDGSKRGKISEVLVLSSHQELVSKGS